MLRTLLPRLTAPTNRAAPLFDAITREARARHWYVEGQVPDTLDGRFAMLATIAALTIARLERGASGVEASVVLTERFVQVMEAEHREMGLGDPKLGRTVRKLVAGLARRVALWREAIAGGDWVEAARESVYGREVAQDALDHSVTKLREIWSRLDAASDQALIEGMLS